MAGDPHSNIFDAAGKKKQDPPPQKKVPEKPLEPLTDLDVQAMFDRMLEMKRDLDKKADDLKNAIALSQKDVVQFFKNSSNFTPEEWLIIQESRADLEKRVWAVVGSDPKKVIAKQKEDKDSKLRKGKMIGGRKNWIPIR